MTSPPEMTAGEILWLFTVCAVLAAMLCALVGVLDHDWGCGPAIIGCVVLAAIFAAAAKEMSR